MSESRKALRGIYEAVFDKKAASRMSIDALCEAIGDKIVDDKESATYLRYSLGKIAERLLIFDYSDMSDEDLSKKILESMYKEQERTKINHNTWKHEVYHLCRERKRLNQKIELLHGMLQKYRQQELDDKLESELDDEHGPLKEVIEDIPVEEAKEAIAKYFAEKAVDHNGKYGCLSDSQLQVVKDLVDGAMKKV